MNHSGSLGRGGDKIIYVPRFSIGYLKECLSCSLDKHKKRSLMNLGLVLAGSDFMALLVVIKPFGCLQ